MLPTASESRTLVWLLFLFVILACAPVLYAQPSAATGAPVQTGSANEWGGSLVWGFFLSSALEWLKRNEKVSLMTEKTAWSAQRIVGVAMAAAAALGVHWTYDAAAGQLVINGLSLAMILPALSEIVRQWVLQEMTYRMTVKPYRPVVTTT